MNNKSFQISAEKICRYEGIEIKIEIYERWKDLLFCFLDNEEN